VRLLLTSGGVTNTSIRDALVHLLGKPIGDSTALWVLGPADRLRGRELEDEQRGDPAQRPARRAPAAPPDAPRIARSAWWQRSSLPARGQCAWPKATSRQVVRLLTQQDGKRRAAPRARSTAVFGMVGTPIMP
jgi:hypothetical protein